MDNDRIPDIRDEFGVSDTLDIWVTPGKTVRVTQIVTMTYETPSWDFLGEEGGPVKELISDMPGKRTIGNILDRSGNWDKVDVSDLQVISVEIL